MTENPDSHVEIHAAPPARRTFWQKLGGGSLAISILIHAIILAIGAVWILKVIQPEEKKIDFMPSSGGGGSPSAESKQKQHRVQMTQPNMARVAAVGVTSNMVLPEPGEVSQMTSLGSMSSGGMSGGLGGSGSGGGRGNGIGAGVGNALGPGMGLGNATKNPFGMPTMNLNALKGTFYDFKQSRSGQPTGVSVDDVVTILNEFTNRGWRESSFNKYFKAKQELYQTKLYIPVMSASEAPAAFNCADQVQPRCWAIVYRGAVTPPKSGKYRFVGTGDDVLVIRLNGKNVFDHGYFSGTTQVRIHRKVAAMKGEEDDPETKKLLRRDYPMEQPLKVYPYPTTNNYNGTVGGLGVGPVFEAEAGKPYTIDILLSELPGGLFCTALMIEEVGVEYEKASTGSPILPIFRLDDSLPPPTNADNAPPYDPKGPVWRVVAGKSKSEI